MGQCYDVELKLKIKDIDSLKDNINKYIDDNQGKGIRFTLDGLDRTKLSDLVRIFLTKRGMTIVNKFEYISSFDASYGWESVLDNFFRIMVPNLNDGSYMIVDIDLGHWKDYVEKGEFKDE